jgi:hypothetical protein
MPALRRFIIVALGLTGILACSAEHADPGEDLPPFAATGAPPGQPPILDHVTHIRVTSPRDDPRTRGFPATITDSATIHDLVAFLESRRASWQPLTERKPQSIQGPIVFVDVFRGPDLLASLAYRGPIELGIEGRDGHLFQVLSPTDANAFAGLLGLQIKVIAVPARNPM